MHSEVVEEAALRPEVWLSRWRANPQAGISELAMQPKTIIRDVLHHLQTKFRLEDLIQNGLSPVAQLIDLLRVQKEKAPKRQFLKVKFSSNAARDLQLRSVLRDPEVYMCHPEPEKAAAIMLVESFRPQIQAFLFNYTEAGNGIGHRAGGRRPTRELRVSAVLYQ